MIYSPDNDNTIIFMASMRRFTGCLMCSFLRSAEDANLLRRRKKFKIMSLLLLISIKSIQFSVYSGRTASPRPWLQTISLEYFLFTPRPSEGRRHSKALPRRVRSRRQVASSHQIWDQRPSHGPKGQCRVLPLGMFLAVSFEQHQSSSR